VTEMLREAMEGGFHRGGGMSRDGILNFEFWILNFELKRKRLEPLNKNAREEERREDCLAQRRKDAKEGEDFGLEGWIADC